MNHDDDRATVEHLREKLREAKAERDQARRGGAVEAFIKRHRDDLPSGSCCWDSLDVLLDNYRLHADTGTPLTEPTPSDGGDAA